MVLTPEQYTELAKSALRVGVVPLGESAAVADLFRQAMQQARTEAMRDARATVALTLENLLDSK